VITRLKLKPGQKGTKALFEKYGDALVCVRYRYDETSRTRIKTVELIVDKKELTPSRKKQQKIEDETLVPVRIEYGERQLGEMARSAGGKWGPKVKLWYIPYGKIKGRELETHIILDTFSLQSSALTPESSRYRHIILDKSPENGRGQKHLIIYTSSASNNRCQDIILDADIE
jgi:hypothetical protein